MTKIEEIQANVEDCAVLWRRNFESTEQLRIESSYLDEAEEEVSRAYRDMYNGTKEAEDWVLEQVVNNPKLSQVVLLAMKNEQWETDMRDILADAMTSFAERNLDV